MTPAWIALGLFTCYALVGFGLRAIVQLRRTGDAGFRGVTGSVGSPEWSAGLLFVIAVVAGVLGPITALWGLAPVSWLDHPWVTATGAVLGVLGIAGTFVTQIAMGNSWRIGVDEAERTELVTEGPFGVVRNPIFTFMLLTGAGLALVVPNVVALVGWILLVVAIHLQVRVVEEPYLARVHGATYAAYCQEVGRFVPRVSVGGGS